MKTYCKHLKLADPTLIYSYITKYVTDKNKYKRSNVIRFYSEYYGIPRKELKEKIQTDCKLFVLIHQKLAQEMAEAIRNRTVEEMIEKYSFRSDVIKYVTILDKGSKKERVLGLECYLFTLFEAVAKYATDPMFDAKLGTYQCASIKGRGQNYAKKAMVKWMSTDADKTKYHIKADVKKCYPSIPHNKLYAFLERDLHKCPDLLYLYKTFFTIYEKYPSPEALGPNLGILIGSPVSKDLCNYYLSYAYHFMSEKLFKKKGKRLISHVIFYMDDFIIFGPNKRDLKSAMDKTISYMDTTLSLIIKPTWYINHTQYIKNGRQRGTAIDFVGIVFHGGEVYEKWYRKKKVRYKKVWLTLRSYIFLKARRKILNIQKRFKKKQMVTQKMAASIISYYGWFKHTNSKKIRKKYKIDKTMNMCKRIVGNYEKGKLYNPNIIYKKWKKKRRCKKNDKTNKQPSAVA